MSMHVNEMVGGGALDASVASAVVEPAISAPVDSAAGRGSLPATARLADVSKNFRFLSYSHRFKEMVSNPFSFWAALGDTFPVLKDINLEVSPGECVGVTGPNGSGKTTLLRLIARAFPPTTGQVTVDGKVVSLLSFTAGMNLNNAGDMNAYTMLALRGVEHERILKLIPSVREFSGLGEFFGRPVKTYSTGMRLRLAFATTAVLDGDLFLYDEMLTVGDSEFQKRCSESIRERIRTRTVMVAHHSPEYLSSFCTRLIHLAQGRIVRDEKV